MAGVNRSATLAVAHILCRDRRCLLELASECIAARPCILQNPSFQLQLCALASRNGLLYEPSERSPLSSVQQPGGVAGGAAGDVSVASEQSAAAFAESEATEHAEAAEAAE